MTKAAAKSVETENETEIDVENMDPNTPIELTVTDLRNANREPATRWGRVKFDAQGVATLKVPLKDVTLVHNFGWLSQEDQEKYLGIAQEAQIVATTSDVSEIQAKLDATTNANTRLAQKNAELEAKLDEVMNKAQKEFMSYQERMDENLKRFGEEMDAANKRFDEAMAAQKTLDEENASLKKQLAEAEKKIKKLEK